jgi:hypothetical protein
VAYLNVPSSLPQAVETKLVSNLGGVHSVGQILLVGKDEEKSIPEFVFVEHALKLFPSLGNTLPIVGVNDEDDTLGILEVYTQALNDESG